jgi:hypothetical protein
MREITVHTPDISPGRFAPSGCNIQRLLQRLWVSTSYIAINDRKMIKKLKVGKNFLSNRPWSNRDTVGIFLQELRRTTTTFSEEK